MTHKSPNLVRALATVEKLESANRIFVNQRIEWHKSSDQKDAIIEHIRASELCFIADLETANDKIKELEMRVTKLQLDDVMAGWAVKANELQLQRALGWIDCSRDVHPGQTELIRGKDLFPKESPNED